MVGNIFLSASVPVPGRGTFHESADPFLIQFAVRELLTVCLGRRRIIWGGHPAITPMVWSVCEDLGVDYARAVTLYQSQFFEKSFPPENARFDNVVVVPAAQDRELSLAVMRETMLSQEFQAAVFVGGMEGVFQEYKLFKNLHPGASVLAVSAPGGAAMHLAHELGDVTHRIDFARLFQEKLGVDPTETRDQVA